MIFDFIKYIKPAWYFNLRPQTDQNYFPKSDLAVAWGAKLDQNFSSSDAQKRDLAYQAFLTGYVPREPLADTIDIWSSVIMPLEDEYRWVRKYFHPLWALYICLIRVLSLNNPVKEVLAYLKTKDQKRFFLPKEISNGPRGSHAIVSDLLNRKPRVSIIIPTLNRYVYLQDVFRDLEKQTYDNFEVIVVDQTDAFDGSIYKGWKLDLRFWHQEEKALWLARDSAIQASEGEYILMYDDDSLVGPDWIEEHLKTIAFFNADISSGVSISKVGAKVPEHYSFYRWSDQLDTGNAMIHRSVFEQIGLFDRQFEKMRMGDGEFGLRAYLAGFRNVSNPKAKRIHLKVGTGGLRQMGSWDAFRPKNLFAPRPIPSVLYLIRQYYGDLAAKMVLLTSVPMSYVHYKWKGRVKSFLFVLVCFPIISPLALMSVLTSWSRSSKMLEKGPKISRLEVFTNKL